MTADQREPGAEGKEAMPNPENRSHFEVILLSNEALRVDSSFALFLNFTISSSGKRSGYNKTLDVISRADQSLEIESGNYRRRFLAHKESMGVRANGFTLSTKTDFIRVGSYDVSSRLCYTSQGQALLLRVESPNPMEHAITPGKDADDVREKFVAFIASQPLPAPNV